MGYNSWYDVMSTLDEKVVRETTDALVSTGLVAAGYNYISLDDCWWVTFKPSGRRYLPHLLFTCLTQGAA
jgi:alpha-galactosidase